MLRNVSTSVKTQHVLQVVGYVIYDLSLFYQHRYSKRHRSIYGLSLDLFAVEFFSSLCTIYLYLAYRFSPLVINQYSQRYPLFFDSFSKTHETSNGRFIVLSHIIFMLQLIRCYFSFKTLRLFYRYRRTKHIHQSFSKMCRTLLVTAIVFFIFTFTCSKIYLKDSVAVENENIRFFKNINMGKYGVFFIDHLTYIWIVQNFGFETLKFVPQVSINYLGSCTQGLSSKYLTYQILANLLFTIVTFHNLFVDTFYTKWYTIPFNYQPFAVFLINLGFSLFIFHQSQILYYNNKPTLLIFSDVHKKSSDVRDIYSKTRL